MWSIIRGLQPGSGRERLRKTKTPPGSAQGRFFVFLCLWSKPALLAAAVVLVAVDLKRHLILLTVAVLLLLRGQFATIGGAIVADFVVDLRFILLQVSRLPGSQLAALHALCDAVLLVLGAFADFTLRVGILHRGVVLVLIYLLGKLILLLVQGGLVSSGQLAVIQRAHVLLFVVQIGLFLFEIGVLPA